MSQCGQMRKKWAFQGYAKIVLRLHTARTKNPDIPKKHPSASHSKITTKIHPDALQNTPMQPQDIFREHKAPTDNNRHQQTQRDGFRHPKTPTGAV